MLTINDLSVSRGSGSQSFTVTLPALSLNQGELLAVSGLSGSGKSTLLEMIGLVLAPNHIGCYQLQSDNHCDDIGGLLRRQHQKKLAEIRARRIGFMLQSGGLLPFLTVEKNIALPCEALGRAVDKQWLSALCRDLNVEHLLSQFPKQLSIGERQRVAFIRAVIHKPLLLLADEPTSALDPEHAQKLFSLMTDLAKQQNIAVLMVTHDWQFIKKSQLRSLTAHVDKNHAVFTEGYDA